MKINKPTSIVFLILILVFSGYIFYRNILPTILIFKNGIPKQQQNTNIEPVAIPLTELEKLLNERNLWEEFKFENFSLQMPKFEELEIDIENNTSLKITDINSGSNLNLNISREATNIESLEDIEPANENAGYTLIGEYDALRIGSQTAPYDTITYYILKNNYLYKLEVEFSTPVSFLDQVLSSFKLLDK